jgi:hypothetical protein
MAKAVGIAASSVVKIWHDHGLAPYRWRSFKLSNEKAFAEKLHDVVGLYVSPPAHDIVLSVDETSQIQALDRTQPALPLKRGRGATMTHEYKRNGTTTLFTALNVLDGSVIGRNVASVTGAKSLSASSTPSRQNCRRTWLSMSSWTTTLRTSSPRCAPGWSVTRAGPSTSCPRHTDGSTQSSRASSPSSPAVA